MTPRDDDMRTWAVFNASRVPTAITRAADGTVLRANGAMLELLGWEEADFLGRTMVEVGFWTRPEERETMLTKLQEEGGWHEVEQDILTRSGETLTVLTSIAIVELDGERCLVNHIYDITDRRRLEAQLRESDERFRQITETLQQGFMLRDLNSRRMLYASPAIERIFGVDRDTIYRDPMALQALVHPDDVQGIVAQREAMTDTTDFEFRIVRPDGETRWIRSRAEPVRLADGRPARIAAVAEDVTEERELRDALSASEERFRLLAEYSTDVIARTAPDGTLLYISPACRALYGYEPEEMIGRSGLDFVHPDDHAAIGADLGAQPSPPDTFTSECRVRRRDGTYVWVEAKSKALRDPGSGRVIELHNAVRDISERKAGEEEIRRARDGAEAANQAKSDFLSRMSHELRTPLNAILGFGELLEGEQLTADELEHVEQITRGGRHLLDLINEVLDLSRIERGELGLSLEPVHVGQVVRETLEMIEPLAAARSIAIRTHAAPELDIHVVADRQRLKQVLLNLLSNAVKYNLEGGAVRVSLGLVGSDALLEVADTGVGIAPELLPRAFEAFERLGAETTDVEGTGLGLALVRRLIEAMGGTIDITSEVGTGTALFVRLPVAVVPAAGAAAAQPGVAPAPRGSRVRAAARSVLLVEDNPSNIRLVESILARRPDVKLLVATQGGLALELAREHRPGLILLDLHLPDMAGEDVLRNLRADARTSDAAVVIVSADATHSQVRRLRILGADDYLTKPFEIEHFLAVVDGLAVSADEQPHGDGEGAPAPDDAIDPKPLDKIKGLYPDDRGLREFVGMFLADTPARILALTSAAEAGDTDGVRSAAHMLRGSCSLTGAHHVVALLSEIETAAVAGELPGAKRMAALEAAYSDAASVLAKRFPSPDGA